VPVAALAGSASAVPLGNRSRESVVLRYGVQLLRTMGSVVAMWRRAAARVAAGVRHARVSGRPILIGGAVAGTFRPPLQKSAKIGICRLRVLPDNRPTLRIFFLVCSGKASID